MAETEKLPEVPGESAPRKQASIKHDAQKSPRKEKEKEREKEKPAVPTEAPANAPPDAQCANKKVKLETSWWVSSRGHKHRVLTWTAVKPKKEVKALLAINHGLGEHIFRYDHVASLFAEKGFIVFGIDHEAHGASQGSPNMHLAKVVDDVCEFHAAQFEKYYNVESKFVYGHSMGALITIHCCLKFPDRYSQGIVLSAPPLSVPMAKPIFWIGKALAAIAPNSQLIKLDITTLSRDPEIVKAYNTDPLVWHNPPPTAFGLSILTLAMEAFDRAKEFKVPYLAMAGSKDTLVEAAKIPEWHDLTSSTDKTCLYWDGFYHELHNEPEKAVVIDQAYHWIKARLNKKFDKVNPTVIASVTNGKMTTQAKL